jgi:hypothetical protein
MGDATIPHSHEDHLAPLVGLVDRLRAEVTELQWRWEALGEELEVKRRRLRLAEATVELMERGQEEEAAPASQEELPAEGAAVHAGEEEGVSQAAQASVGCVMSPSRWSMCLTMPCLVLCSTG